MLLLFFLSLRKKTILNITPNIYSVFGLWFFFYQNLQDSLFLAQLQLPGFKIFPNSAEETAPS